MSFSERKGDLFAATDLDAIAHGVNCKGVMGAGVAGIVAKRWPDILPFYRRLCEHDDYRLLGDSVSYRTSRPPIFNLFTQYRPGPDAKLRWVAQSVGVMLEQCEKEPELRRIGMPRIGCGIGGLEWVEVRMILELLANESPVELVVFSL